MAMWRQVVKTEWFQSPYTKAGQGRRVFLLSCGHERHEKTSYRIPTTGRMLCHKCTPK